MWQDIVPFDNVGNNISEVIIRGTRFANDWYYIWGSYKGAFNDLRGDGLSVVAWDGFVPCIPAHALFSRFPENFRELLLMILILTTPTFLMYLMRFTQFQ